MINVTVVGYQTKNGMKLLKNIEKAIQTIEIKINLKIISRHGSKNYGIHNVPGLVIDGKIISQGKVLSERKIHKLLSSCG